MNYIEQLQQLTLDAIKNEGLKSAVQELVEDYVNTPNKEVFEEVAMENAKTLYELTKQAQPELFKEKKEKEEEKPKEEKKSDTKEAKKVTKKSPQEIDEKIKEVEEGLAVCRRMIREDNKRKREARPPKPKETRQTKLKKKVLSLVRLTPPELLADAKVRKENRAIIRDTVIKLMTNWKMTSFKQVENAVNKALDEAEKKYKDND